MFDTRCSAWLSVEHNIQEKESKDCYLMSVFWIVLLSIVGSLELIGIGFVINDMVYYRQEGKKSSNPDGKSEEG